MLYTATWHLNYYLPALYMYYLMVRNQTMILSAGKNRYLLSAHLRLQTLMISLLLHLSISMGI